MNNNDELANLLGVRDNWRADVGRVLASRSARFIQFDNQCNSL